MADDPAHQQEGSPTDGAVVLAAGKGTRMKSRLPKVLQELAGKPMLERVLNTLAATGIPRPVVIIGYGAKMIRARIGDRCTYVVQEQQLGTGHAARVAMDTMPPAVERVLLVHGDEPMVEADTYREMLREAERTGAAIVLLTTHMDDTRDLGRVVRDEAGAPCALVQEADLTPEQRTLTEVNLGAYVFDAAFLRRILPDLQPHRPKNEYYLTDAVEIAVREGRTVAAVVAPGGDTLMGANDLVQLEAAGQVLYRRTNRRHMLNGVRIIDSASTFIDDEVEIAPDTVIHPFTILSGPTRIGGGCRIGPGSRILDSQIGDECTVVASTVVDSTVGVGVRIGPYAHLRPGTRLEAGVEIGTGSEIKGSSLGPGTRMHHFGYVGDAQIGANVNIGAGVVTCNFDGRTKNRTVVGDNAFIGSDTMLRAPITVGAGGYTGAGSVVTRDVPAGTTVAGVPARVLRQAQAAESEPHTGPGGERGADGRTEDL